MKCLPVLISGALMNEAESCLEGARRSSCGKLEDEIKPGWNYIFKMSVYRDNVCIYGHWLNICVT